jgi:copper chaperone
VEKAKMSVEGMSCEHCVMTITKGLESLDGIGKVEVNLDAGQVSVEYDQEKLSLDTIKAKVQELGYQAS